MTQQPPPQNPQQPPGSQAPSSSSRAPGGQPPAAGGDQSFSRPGAVDLTRLQPPAGGAPAAGGAAGSSYSMLLDEENFQSVLESSMTAPVILAFYSRTQSPESGRMADDLASLSEEFEGRFLIGLVDIDATPQIAQAMQIPSVPLVVAVVDGRPMPLLQEAPPYDQLRTLLQQVQQQLTTQGVTGRHQPRAATAAPQGEEDDQGIDPRYAPAQDALEAGDIDGAVREYQKLIEGNPADTEAAAGLAMATVLQRTQHTDLNAARAEAAAHPDDVDAQTMCADLDMVGGHVEDAFARLVELVRRSAGDDRDKAREHLLGLFAAVGNDDPRVLAARRSLASALF